MQKGCYFHEELTVVAAKLDQQRAAATNFYFQPSLDYLSDALGSLRLHFGSRRDRARVWRNSNPAGPFSLKPARPRKFPWSQVRQRISVPPLRSYADNF